jgi:putative ABC transport system permease protein
MEVVGVAGDVRLSRLEDEPEAALYVPYLQQPRGRMSLALVTSVPIQSLAEILKDVLLRMDPAVPLSRVATLETLVSDSMAERRVITLSLTLLALLPLLLASVGLFAILAYHVSRRRHEMGVRMALGAGAAHVMGLVLRQGLGLVGLGVVLGLGGAWAGTRLLQGLLFGIEAIDPLTFSAVTGLVFGVSMLACAAPVWRAARSDPRKALQAD